MSLTYGFTLGELTTSENFSDALHAVAGDGITPDGGRFALTVNGFTGTLSSGYALAAGRWVENDEPLKLTIKPSGNNDDRTDALAVQVDYKARKAALDVLYDIDPAAIRADQTPIRNGETYCVLLYFIRVRRGATSLTPDDVTDIREDSTLCGRVVPLSDIAGDVLRVYQFLTSGIDLEVARLIGLSNQVIQNADAAIAELDKTIQHAGGAAEIGELLTSRKTPEAEKEWLLCDGGGVPPEYPALSALLPGGLPNISKADDRYRTFIYGGAPVSV